MDRGYRLTGAMLGRPRFRTVSSCSLHGDLPIIRS